MLTLCAIQWAELRRLVGQMWPSGREFDSSGDSYNTGLIVCQERFITKQSTVYEQKQNNK